ncbi:hypothetical protein TVAG_471120 [Trichomonas vaginalis G3]|uniref:Uncharacterized protein n=1 Tax=Trichomonas vaginalis (strain ATCC PRA-98 / G3) TaxID=412133 RepID=A2G797_TRIV3|nr:nerve growth factor signaling pathway [Trichomonas vaginalis G3]EAX86968.1 hypothetical protein TVAG_471120 [Trichomonas vaginalis G3]KAI5517749.1 nerve growth factor signaling pathway [Trichomonas vaginalis G3]|eukprot:XP_001299898.1 hypothetical protein [Trichomonas vaginalis G3]
MRDIKAIMKHSRLTVDQFITLLKQSHSTINARKLYTCTRKANITIKNFEEVVKILKSVKRYMKFSIFDGIIDFLKHNEKGINYSTNETEIVQGRPKAFQNENENATKDTTINETVDNYNLSRDILTRITELKESSEFETVYKFLDEISSKANHEMILKSCKEGLWKKITTIKSVFNPQKNVLHFAIETGNLRLVQLLIECGCDKEMRDYCGHTPLIKASKNGRLEIVKYLVSVGANKEAKDIDGFTPLIWASENGKLDVVQYLISVGANIEAEDHYGKTALIRASWYNKLDVVKYLISVGANKEAKDNLDKYTPLIYPSANGYLDVVKYLVSVGADKEAKDCVGFTPLIWASKNGRLEIVKYLVSVGANKEAKDNHGYTPLIWASKNGKLDVVKYLISAGANKEAKDNNGSTALMVATGKVGDYLKTICAN